MTSDKTKDVPGVDRQIETTDDISIRYGTIVRDRVLTSRHGPGRYSVLYVDPPWLFGDANKNGKRGAVNKYPCMTMGELYALRPFIDALAAPNCALAMWWVSAMPQEALDLVRVWGFDRVNMTGLVWYKQTKNGKEHFGLGRTTRPAIESCLFAYRGRLQVADKSVRQVITAKTGEHSEKPAEARKRIERIWGDVKRVELFARQRVPGWDAWGNQV